MVATDCVGFLDAGLPPVPPTGRRKLSALAELIAAELWTLADWKGDRAQCERAAQAVARLVVSLNRTNVIVRDLAAEEETRRLADELAGARATIDHMRGAMSWLSGHDRQGLDHLAEANYEARAREAAVAEAALQRLTDWCDGLDDTAFHVAGRTEAVRVHPVAAAVRHQIAGPAEQEGPK